MLTKLMKYDFKSIGKNILPLYILTIAFSLFTRLLNFLSKFSKIIKVFSSFANFFTIILVTMLLFITFILSIRRYYSHLFKEEGYLTNMLPVKIEKHILSKFIVSTCFCIITLATISFSLYIVYYDANLRGFLGPILEPITTLLPIFVVYIILACLSYILLFVSSYSIGQLSDKNKIGYSFIGGIVLYSITQMIMLGGLLIFILIEPEFLTMLENPDVNVFLSIFSMAIIVQIACISLYFLVTIFALKKKMDLE